MAYRLLVFDADGTLFDYERGEAYALKAAFSECQLPYDGSTVLPVYRGINREIWGAFERGEILQREISTRRFTRLLEKIDIDGDIDALGDAYLGRLAEADFLIEGALETVRKLSASYLMALVTNGLARVQRGRFSRSPITQYFDPIVISDEVGVQKPDPAIFTHVLKAHPDFSPEQMLMIGDSLSSDIAGGHASGMDTCWFHPLKGDPAPSAEDHTDGRPKPTYRISNLSELTGLLL